MVAVSFPLVLDSFFFPAIRSQSGSSDLPEGKTVFHQSSQLGSAGISTGWSSPEKTMRWSGYQGGWAIDLLSESSYSMLFLLVLW
jgi:hypothetical protein